MHKLESCCQSLWFFVVVIWLAACDTPTDLPINTAPSPTPLVISDVSIVDPYLKQCIEDLGKTFVNEISEIQCNLKPTDTTDLSGIEKFTQLKTLILSGLNQTDLTTISQLTQLTELRLTQSNISDINALEKLNQLTILDLSDNEITDISALQNLNNLVTVDLSGNDNLDCNDRITLAKIGPTVTLPPLCNQPPTPVVDNIQTVQENTSVTLNGSKSTDADGEITTYFWEQIPGLVMVDLNRENSAQANFIAPEIQDNSVVLAFKLTITDDQGTSANTTLIVNVIDKNQPPTVDPVAGNEGDLSTTPMVNEETLVLLDATGVIDNDGSIRKYEWRRIDGASVKEIRNRDQAIANFTAPVTSTQTSITFEITVTDDKGASTSVPITITIDPVNILPTANAGSNSEEDERTSVTLRGTGEDRNPEDGSFDGFIETYQWIQKEDNAAKVNLIQPNPTEGIATFIAPDVNTDTLLTFILTVTDDEGATATDEVQITIKPLTEGSPIANAGGPRSVNEAQSVTLDGRSSADTNGGFINVYEWTILSIKPPIDPALNANWLTSATNLPFTLPTDAESGIVSFVTPIVKTQIIIEVQLQVTDDDALSSSNTATIEVNPVNLLPMASFLVEGYTGDAIEINEQTAVTLNASASADTDGQIITYEWINASADNFPDPIAWTNTVITQFKTPTVTVNQSVGSRQLKIRLTVTDDEKNQNPASHVTTTPQHFEIPITILPINAPPVADITINPVGKLYERKLVELDASGSSDPDAIEGDILLYQWELLTQDSSIELINDTEAKASFTAPETLTPLVLAFKVTITDPEGGVSTATTPVTIEPQNDPPVANAGPDQTSAVGKLITLMGSGSDPDLPDDPDGDTLIYQWTLPNNVALEGFNINAKRPRFTVAEGTAAAKYTFTLNVFDAENLSSTQPDTIDVIIVNSAPTANAGENRNVDPRQTISLDGSLSKDPNGDALTYQWIAPTGIILSNINIIQPTFDVPTMAGGTSLTFELTVNDAGIEPSSATVTFIVNNLAPVADAGNNQIAKVGDLVTLDGSGSQDPNEPINQLKFQWKSLNNKILLSNPTAIKPAFTVPEGISDTLAFELIVTDTENRPSPVATTVVSISNTKPIANAGADKTVTAGTLVTLDGSTSKDPNNNTLNYQWSTSSGITLNNITTAMPRFTHNTPGTYPFTLIVNDGTENSAPDEVIITLTNRAPTAEFTISPTPINVGTHVVLDASTSSDPDTGDTPIYTWTSPQVTDLPSTKLSGFTVTATLPKTIDITLTVSDGKGGSATKTVSISVKNRKPIANAGPDKNAVIGKFVALDGSASSDPDGDSFTYLWTAHPGITLSSNTVPNPKFKTPKGIASPLTFSLIVNDGKLDSLADTVVISFTNQNPVAAFTVSPTPINVGTAVVLDASTSDDPDGDTPLIYTWTSPQVSPLPNTKLSGFTVTAAMGNTIDITLTVSDGKGGFDTKASTLAIPDPPPNDPPVANAGADQAAAVGDRVTLDGSGSADPEIDPLLYEWSTQADIVLSDINVEQPTFNIPAGKSGMLSFTLTVTEDRMDGQSTIDTVNIYIVDTTLKTCINTEAAAATITDYTQLTSLTCLGLSISGLTGIHQFTQLTTLDFSSNSIGNVTPLASITGIVELNLANNSIATGISSLTALINLTLLDLSENTITCTDYKRLNQTFSDITHLSLPPNPCPPAIKISDLVFTDTVLKSCVDAADITGLVEDMLTLDCSTFSGISTLNGIEQLTSVQMLDISGHNAIACAELTPLQSTITTVVWPASCVANLNPTTSPTETTIAFQWNNIMGADQYILKNMTSGSPAIMVAPSTSGTIRYTDGTINPLASGTPYSYELTADFFSGVTQSEVNHISVTTLLPPTTGSLSLSEDASADLDSGTVTTVDADIWFEFVSTTERYITPQKNVTMAVYTPDTAPTRDKCMKLSLTKNSIPVNDTTTDRYVCLLTSGNRISTFYIKSPVGASPGTLHIDFTTWNPPLP